jgi:glycosyltransferase involved in cell wall biosynthesis
MPTVSVLLPVRDGGAHLDEAMQSLLSQTVDDIEVIAVDDGSTDG